MTPPSARCAAFLAAALWAAPLAAQGHGPIYGLSTPTLGQGGWSLDVGVMGRLLDGSRAVMLRPMLSYGITEDLQVFASVPLPLERDAEVPPSRAFTRMPAGRDVEAGLGWRFQRRGTGVGSRRETTLWLAVDHDLDDLPGGAPSRPSGFAAVVTGYASRSLYLWAGGAHQRPLNRAGTRPADRTMASLVVGYRPRLFREDYPSPDWRGFLEVVGEWSGERVIGGAAVEGTDAHELFVAVTVLGLFGSWGVTGGPALPLVQNLGPGQPEDRMRFALNVTIWR